MKDWYEFAQSAWVPEEERGFWYPGVVKKLKVYYMQHFVPVTRRAFMESAINQIYNSSPILTALLSENQ